jgi:hypothetical protein
MELLTFILVCYGATAIITHGKIFDGIRPKSYYWTCSMCVGFAVGMLAAYLEYNTFLFTFDNNIVTLVMLGCLASGTSYILDMLFNDSGLQLATELISEKDNK